MDILSFWEILKSIIFLILNKQGPRGFTRNTSRSHPPLNFVNLSKRVVPPPLYPYLIEEAVVVYSSFCLLSCLSDVTIFVFLSFWRFFCLALSLFLNKFAQFVLVNDADLCSVLRGVGHGGAHHEGVVVHVDLVRVHVMLVKIVHL